MGQALQFVHQLRTDPQAWHVCASLFARTQPRAPSEIVRHVCLEVVNSAIHTQNLDGASLLFLKDTFLGYVRAAYGGPEARKQADGSGGGAPGRGGTDGAGQDAGGGAVVTVVDSPNLQNKLAQTLTYLFVVLYKDAWVSYFDDFLALTGLPGTSQGQTQQENVSGVFFYLRILSSVHDEIADMLLSRQGSDAKRNAELKDLLRARDVPKVAKSLQEILAVYGTRNDAVVEMTMKIIGKWVSWIDISLVVNPDMLAQLLPIIGRNKPAGVDGSPPGTEDKARDAAIDAFTEIVGKKMKAQDKVDMIVFLNLHQIVSELIASPPLNDFKGTPRYDTDLAEAVAKLVNTVVADLVRVLEGSGGAQAAVPDETRARGEQLLHDFVPLLLRFFSDEYDEICSTVIPSLTDLLTYLRKVEKARPRYADMLPAILNAIILKMRYDETSTWGNEDEQTDEAEFQELRKKLQNLQKSVAAVDQSLYIDVLSNLVAGTFQTLEQRGSQMDWRDVDLALHEMHLFGELTLPNSGITSKNQPNNLAVENLAGMMRKMLNSGKTPRT